MNGQQLKACLSCTSKGLRLDPVGMMLFILDVEMVCVGPEGYHAKVNPFDLETIDTWLRCLIIAAESNFPQMILRTCEPFQARSLR